MATQQLTSLEVWTVLLQYHVFQVLYKAGEKKWGTNESAFTVMLVSKSYAELRCIFEEYEKLAKHSIEVTLKKEFSGSLLQAMLAIGKLWFPVHIYW